MWGKECLTEFLRINRKILDERKTETYIFNLSTFTIIILYSAYLIVHFAPSDASFYHLLLRWFIIILFVCFSRVFFSCAYQISHNVSAMYHVRNIYIIAVRCHKFSGRKNYENKRDYQRSGIHAELLKRLMKKLILLSRFFFLPSKR